jgi:hypothetical protein
MIIFIRMPVLYNITRLRILKRDEITFVTVLDIYVVFENLFSFKAMKI